jgi:hypothetical protein
MQQQQELNPLQQIMLAGAAAAQQQQLNMLQQIMLAGAVAAQQQQQRLNSYMDPALAALHAQVLQVSPEVMLALVFALQKTRACSCSRA